MSMLKLVVAGTVGRDAEVKEVGQSMVVEVSVAVNQRVKGEQVTTWIRCHLWNEFGAKLAPHLRKGTHVTMMGEASLREYTTKDGKHGVSLEVRVDSCSLQGSSAKREDKDPWDA